MGESETRPTKKSETAWSTKILNYWAHQNPEITGPTKKFETARSTEILDYRAHQNSKTTGPTKKFETTRPTKTFKTTRYETKQPYKYLLIATTGIDHQDATVRSSQHQTCKHYSSGHNSQVTMTPDIHIKVRQ